MQILRAKLNMIPRLTRILFFLKQCVLDKIMSFEDRQRD